MIVNFRLLCHDGGSRHSLVPVGEDLHGGEAEAAQETQLVAVVQAFGVTVGLGMPLVDGHIPRLGQEMGAHHDRQGAWDGGDRNHGPHCRVVEAKAMEKPKTRHDEWGGVGNAKGTVL